MKDFENILSNDVIIKSLDLLSLAHDSVINTSYEIKIDEVKLQMQYSKIELNESDDINKNDFFGLRTIPPALSRPLAAEKTRRSYS